MNGCAVMYEGRNMFGYEGGSVKSSINTNDVLVVREMLFKGFTTDIIARYTGISLSRVESIVSGKMMEVV